MEHKIRMFIEIVLALILPPLGVFFPYGCCSHQFIIAILLTILGYLPGILYAFFVIIEAHLEGHHRGLKQTEPATSIREPFVERV